MQEFWELALPSSSSQPPPACPGWCFTAEREENGRGPHLLQAARHLLRDSGYETTGQLHKLQAHNMSECFLPPARQGGTRACLYVSECPIPARRRPPSVATLASIPLAPRMAPGSRFPGLGSMWPADGVTAGW